MTPRRPPAQPTAATLREAALGHLARYATTRAGLLRVLRRRIDRWAQAEGAEAEAVAPLRAAAAAEVERLVGEGLIDDAAYAERRGRRLLQAGRSPQAAVAQLRARGIAGDLAHDAVPDGEADVALDAALVLARRRRIGPFRAVPETDLRREQGILARAGFAREITLRALAMPPDEAELRIIAFRREG